MVGMKPDSIDRRTALKTVTCAAVGSNVPVKTLASEPRVAAGEVRGFAYDTLTHKTSSVVSGQIKPTNDSAGLKGHINIADFSIPMGHLNSVKDETKRPIEMLHGATLNESKFQVSIDGHEYPLQIRIWEMNNHIAGILSRPTTKFGELGFLIKKDVDEQRLMKQFTPDSKWKQIEKQSGTTFDIPSDGLPRDSSLQGLREIKTGGGR